MRLVLTGRRTIRPETHEEKRAVAEGANESRLFVLGFDNGPPVPDLLAGASVPARAARAAALNFSARAAELRSIIDVTTTTARKLRERIDDLEGEQAIARRCLFGPALSEQLNCLSRDIDGLQELAAANHREKEAARRELADMRAECQRAATVAVEQAVEDAVAKAEEDHARSAAEIVRVLAGPLADHERAAETLTTLAHVKPEPTVAAVLDELFGGAVEDADGTEEADANEEREPPRRSDPHATRWNPTALSQSAFADDYEN
jgi:hypothetical protein